MAEPVAVPVAQAAPPPLYYPPPYPPYAPQIRPRPVQPVVVNTGLIMQIIIAIFIFLIFIVIIIIAVRQGSASSSPTTLTMPGMRLGGPLSGLGARSDVPNSISTCPSFENAILCEQSHGPMSGRFVNLLSGNIAYENNPTVRYRYDSLGSKLYARHVNVPLGGQEIVVPNAQMVKKESGEFMLVLPHTILPVSVKKKNSIAM